MNNNSKKQPDTILRQFIVQLAGSTIARASLLLGAALGAFIGTATLYFLSINKGMAIDSSLILTFIIIGVGVGLIADLVIYFIVFTKKK